MWYSSGAPFGIVAAERRRRLRAPGGEARRDPAAHEVVEPLGRRRDRLVDRREPVRPRHLDAGDEVRDHVARAEDLGRVEDPPVPLLAPDVALLAGRDDREEALVPDLVVRVVDRDPVVLVPLDVGLRERLRDHLAEPAAGEALLDRLRVAAVEVGLGEPVDGARDRAAGERVRLRDAVGVVAVDQRERLEHVLDRLHARVRPPCLLVLAPVVVDVAELALLVRAEVLAEAQHGEVDQVAPLDRRGRLHHRLAVRERVAVVLGHRREHDVGDLASLERRACSAPSFASRGAVRRLGVHADGDDRAAQLPRAAGERDLLGRAPERGLAELGERLLVEGEDEVRLRLHLAVEVVGERRLLERDAGAQEVLLQHRLRRHAREPLHQPFDQLCPGGAHTVTVSPTRVAVRHPCGVGHPRNRVRGGPDAQIAARRRRRTRAGGAGAGRQGGRPLRHLQRLAQPELRRPARRRPVHAEQRAGGGGRRDHPARPARRAPDQRVRLRARGASACSSRTTSRCRTTAPRRSRTRSRTSPRRTPASRPART